MTADEARRGLTFGLCAYGLWGLFPLFWPLLEPANAVEILACRIVFSLIAVGVVLAVTGHLAHLRLLSRGAVIRLAIAGAVIAINWGAYIWGVNHEQVVQTSLGYFINPIVTVGLGVIVLGERLRRVQWVALGLGVLAVAVLTVNYGQPPWLALLLAFSFGTYGLLKNRVAVAPPEGLFIEAAVMTVPALAALGILAAVGQATWIGPAATPAHWALLAASGPVTAIPLLFFAGAANRLPLSTLGLLQYLAPVMQFLIGVGVRHEPMPPARLLGFGLVWVALAVLTTDALHHRRTRRTPLTAPIDPIGQH